MIRYININYENQFFNNNIDFKLISINYTDYFLEEFLLCYNINH